MRMFQGIALACVGAMMGVTAAWAEPTVLTVTGEGEVAAVPDMAWITMGVLREAKEAGAAMEAMSEGAAGVLARLEALGIDARDMQTGQLSLQPMWDHSSTRPSGQPRIVGYQAQTQVIVKVRDLGALGGLLDAVVADGANGFQGLRFALKDPRPVEDDARRAAFADAMAKAELFAGAAGLPVSRIVSIAEAGGGGGPRPMMEMAMARDGGVPVAGGEVTTQMRITLVVELGE